MSKLGMLKKIVSQNPEGIISLLRTDQMLGIITRRGLSSSNISCSKIKSVSPSHRPQLFSIHQCRCSNCNNRLRLNPPHRQMSMLDVFRRKKVKHEEIARDDGDEEIPGYQPQVFSLEEEKIELSEEEIEAKRNKSGLRDSARRLVQGEVPYSEPKFWTHHTVKYKQKVYGNYGEKSGINPGIMWPTRDELKEKIEYEKICNPFTIQEMVRAKKELKIAEQVEFERREKEVEGRMELVEKFKDELRAKQQAKENELEAAKERREKLMEEVRRHFGYTVDPKDDRFKELLEKKEKEQRKAMKEARKIEKQQRVLDKLEVKKPVKPQEVKPKLEEDDD